MAAVLRGWSQDLFLSGHRLGRWMTDYIDLEESLAVGSMAQDDLAHAGLLLEVTGVDERGRDHLFYGAPPEQWRCSRLMASSFDQAWADVVASSVCLSEAVLVLAGWLEGSLDPERARGIRTMASERRLHAEHWERWLCLLVGEESTRAEIQMSMDRAVELASDLFGAEDVGGGVPGSTPTELPEADLPALHREWGRRLEDRARRCSMAIEVPGSSVPRGGAASVPTFARLVAEVQALRGPDVDATYTVYR